MQVEGFKDFIQLKQPRLWSRNVFVIVKMVHPDTHTGWSYIKKNLETTRMSLFKHNTPKDNLEIAEWMNKISIAGESYY